MNTSDLSAMHASECGNSYQNMRFLKRFLVQRESFCGGIEATVRGVCCYLRCGRSTRAAQGSERSVMDWFCSSGNWISDSTSSGTAGCSDVELLA